MCAIGSDVIATGDNSAGNGGDGYFSGALMHAPVAVFDPINIAMAGLTGRETERHTLHPLSLISAAFVDGPTWPSAYVWAVKDVAASLSDHPQNQEKTQNKK